MTDIEFARLEKLMIRMSWDGKSLPNVCALVADYLRENNFHELRPYVYFVVHRLDEHRIMADAKWIQRLLYGGNHDNK
jgi:hypothetical protein